MYIVNVVYKIEYGQYGKILVGIFDLNRDEHSFLESFKLPKEDRINLLYTMGLYTIRAWFEVYKVTTLNQVLNEIRPIATIDIRG